MFNRKMTPKNKGFNLFHAEWKCEMDKQDDSIGVMVTIKDTQLSYNKESLPFLFESLAKQDPDFKEALLLSVDMLNGKSSGVPKLDRLNEILGDLLKTSKSK